MNRAQTYRKLGEWKKASKDCESILLLNPKNVKGNYILGICMVEQGKMDTEYWDSDMKDGISYIKTGEIIFVELSNLIGINLASQENQTTKVTQMTEVLEKAQLIYTLKKQEMRDVELQMLSFLVSKILSEDLDHELKQSVLKKIDKEIQDGAVDEPPQHLTCPITFVSFNL